MEVHLKKPHLIVLCQAFDGDSILSPDITHFYWRRRQTKLKPGDFAILFETGLMEWIDGLDFGQSSSEGVITPAGKELVEELGLCTYAYSK
jgi:hypothetical protein